MIDERYGVAFLIAAAAGLAVWYQSKMRHRFVNVVTQDAGEVTPQVPVSNSTVIDLSQPWDTPFYLRDNYPLTRGGTETVPATAYVGMPDSFGPQQVAPNL